MDFLALIWNLLIYFAVAAVVILIVARLNLGLEATGFVGALIAAIVIAVVSAVVVWLLGLFNITISGGWLGAIIGVIIAAVVLMVADRFAPGIKVNGFVGAIIAAIAIGVIYFLISLIFPGLTSPLAGT